MSELRGADVERLDDLARFLRQQAAAVGTLERAVSAATRELPSFWIGPDSNQFVGSWSAEHRPSLLSAVRGLESVADTVEVNARAQEQTSATDGGGLPGGLEVHQGGWSIDLADGLGARPGGWSIDLPGGLDAEPGGWSITRPLSFGGSLPGWGGGVTDALGDLGGWASDTGGALWGETTEAAGDLWDAGYEVGGDVLAETGHRFSELGQYGDAYLRRWAGNPIQSFYDEVTWTGPFERAVGAGSILLGGGEFAEGVGGGDAEFITGLPFEINDAITLGHSVLVDESAIGSANLIEHELQHVRDLEAVGGQTFYLSYLGNWGLNILQGQDPALGGEAYENIWWEQRGHDAQFGGNPPDLIPSWDPRKWFD